MISPLNIVLGGVMLMRMHYVAGQDESMEDAHHVVILNMSWQQSCNGKREHPNPWKANFPGL